MGPQEGAWVRAHRPQPLSPSPLSSLGGSCSPAVFLPQGWDEPTLRKGLWGPRPPAHPRSLVVLNIFKHTHTHTHTHTHIFTEGLWLGPIPILQPCTVRRAQQNKNKNKNTKSIFWPLHCRSALVIFLFALPLLGLQGCPCPWRPRDSGLWFAKLADEVFVCLFVTDRMVVGGRSSRKSSSITCSGWVWDAWSTSVG